MMMNESNSECRAKLVLYYKQPDACGCSFDEACITYLSVMLRTRVGLSDGGRDGVQRLSLFCIRSRRGSAG